MGWGGKRGEGGWGDVTFLNCGKKKKAPLPLEKEMEEQKKLQRLNPQPPFSCDS